MTINSTYTRIEAIESGYLATVIVSSTANTITQVQISGNTWEELQNNLNSYLTINKPGTEWSE